jgi:hypothetical protein
MGRLQPEEKNVQIVRMTEWADTEALNTDI